MTLIYTDQKEKKGNRVIAHDLVIE